MKFGEKFGSGSGGSGGSKVTMPQYVAQVEEGDEGLFVEVLYRDGECLVEHGDLLINTHQAEVYAAAKVREALEEATQLPE